MQGRLLTVNQAKPQEPRAGGGRPGGGRGSFRVGRLIDRDRDRDRRW
jgi:hypothetical protein